MLRTAAHYLDGIRDVTTHAALVPTIGDALSSDAAGRSDRIGG